MLRRRLTLGLVAAIAAIVLAGCGSSSSSSSSSTIGSLYTLIGDTPLCDILSFRLTATGLDLVPTTGTTNATILNSNVTAIKVGFSILQEFSTVLALTSVVSQTYNQGSFAVSAPVVVRYDPTQNPPISSVTATTSAATTMFPVEPPVTISASAISVMQMDLDLQHSVQFTTNSQGQVTGATVTPVVTVGALSASSTGFTELDDLVGFVLSVNPNTFTSGTPGTSSATTFAGSMSIQLLSSSVSGAGGPAVNVSFPTDYFAQNIICASATVSNQPCSSMLLNQVLTPSFVEVDALIDPNGNLVAKSVQLEDVENVAQSMLAFIGYVLTKPTTDSSGNVAFDLFILEEEPDDDFAVPLDSVVTVTAPASTVYSVGQPANDFANLGFGAAQLAVGEEVVVHGIFTRPTPPPPPAVAPLTTVAAAKIYLKLQTHLGNFSSLLADASDDHTGAFVLAPCASLFNNAPIYVFTDSTTNFVNLSGLSALTAQPTLTVKGLLEFQPKATTINGVTVPAGSLVLLARQVHQLT
ncbi:MAG TPA: hypothetical protein VGW33_12720 [Terriglobia bacterium]|nr:hypothetical protein [Terriglobia bacterium]